MRPTRRERLESRGQRGLAQTRGGKNSHALRNEWKPTRPHLPTGPSSTSLPELTLDDMKIMGEKCFFLKGGRQQKRNTASDSRRKPRHQSLLWVLVTTMLL